MKRGTLISVRMLEEHGRMLALLSKFKKGDIVDCFLPNHSNQALL